MKYMKMRKKYISSIIKSTEVTEIYFTFIAYEVVLSEKEVCSESSSISFKYVNQEGVYNEAQKLKTVSPHHLFKMPYMFK